VTATLLLLIKLSVAGLILAIGMSSTLRDLLYLWRRPGLLLRSLLAMYVAVPLVALLVARSLTLPTPVEVAILVLAISAGAPLRPRKLIHLGNDAYVFSLVVTSSLLAIVTIPAWLTVLAPLHGRSGELTAGDVAGVVIPSFLALLALGMVVQWLAPETSERIAACSRSSAWSSPSARSRCWAPTSDCWGRLVRAGRRGAVGSPSVEHVREQPVCELWLKPCRLRRHQLAGIGDGHQLLHARRVQR
jgi:hypothetical protein